MMPLESPTSAECPPDAAFVDLLEGRLDEPAVANLERHFETCSACRILRDALASGEADGTRGGAGERDDSLARALLHDRSTWRSSVVASSAHQAGEDPTAPSIGETIGGRYALVRVLGAGGMGSVYEAAHIATGERVAVKLINRRLLVPGSEAPSRFRREARAAGALDSPHIVRIVDSGIDEHTSSLYLVMEYLSGEDLQQLIDRAGPLRPEVALRIAAQTLLGLETAHEAGIVHRDIKPANLFLARDAAGGVTVKLLDFGIAKVLGDPLSLPNTTGLTHTGGFLGSPLYMSPEQVQNSKDVDHRTDLWSLGSALYCALAGRAPHRDVGSVGKLILAICSSPARPVRELAPWIAPEVADATHRALTIDREGRYPSAGAMREAVQALVAGDLGLREEMLVGLTAAERAAAVDDWPAIPRESVAAVAPPTRSRWFFAPAAALVLGIGITVGYGIHRSPRGEPLPSAPEPRAPRRPGVEAAAVAPTEAPEAGPGMPSTTLSVTAKGPDPSRMDPSRMDPPARGVVGTGRGRPPPIASVTPPSPSVPPQPAAQPRYDDLMRTPE